MTSPKRTTPKALEQLRSRRAELSHAIESLEQFQRCQALPSKSSFLSGGAGVATPPVPLPYSDGLPPILAEQFTYLVQHPRGCALDCLECTRLKRIADILMEPFQTAMYPSDTTDGDIPAGL